jgi:hypothetical protein
MSTTELATRTESKELAVSNVSDALAAYADAVSPQYIVGEMMRFSKGDWLIGDNTVPLGKKVVVNFDELMAGWIKWRDNKPVETIMVRVTGGIPPKKREDLGDTDERQWEKDKDGNPRDPWQFTNYLPLMSEEDGTLYTFSTSSRGGISAIARLARTYAQHRRRHPKVFPLVELAVESYQHKIREYGRIKVPAFAPAGYTPKTGFLTALASAGLTAVDYHTEDSGGPDLDTEDDFKDEVPF